MARIRTIKPEFWESESIGRLSMGARLLFLASLNLADDEGLLRWNEAYLSSQAFVYDDLDMEMVREWMRELVTERIVFPYVAGKTNQKLGWIINFKSHQVINRPQPSKLPHPSIQSSSYKEAIYERDKGICHLCNAPIDPIAPLNEVKSKAPSLDHVTPVSKGGSDYPSNLKTAHISCNKSRKNNPIDSSLNDSVNDSCWVNEGHSLNGSLTEAEGKGREKEGKDNTSSIVTESAGDFQRIFDHGVSLIRDLETKDTSHIHQWINAGCDADKDILPTITRIAKLGRAETWKYFTKAIMDAKATRQKPPPQGSPRQSKPSQSPKMQNKIVL